MMENRLGNRIPLNRLAANDAFFPEISDLGDAIDELSHEISVEGKKDGWMKRMYLSRAAILEQAKDREKLIASYSMENMIQGWMLLKR